MTSPDAPERERANTLLEIASDDPDTVSTAELVTILVHGTPPARSVAVEAYEVVVDARPNAATSVATELHCLLDDENVRAKAAGAIAHLAERGAAPFKKSIPSLIRMVEPPIEFGRDHAVHALLVLSSQFPRDVESAVSPLLDILENEMDANSGHKNGSELANPSFGHEEPNRETGVVRFAAAQTLLHVTRERPAAAVNVIPQVGLLLDDPKARIRGVASEILGAVAKEYPDHVSPHLEKLATLLTDDPEQPVPWKAASALAMLVDEYPEEFADTVADDAGELTLLLNDTNPEVRGVGVALLTYVVEYYPNAIEPATDRLCELLTSENPLIRANAARALRDAESVVALDTLEKVARNDPNSDVQEIANAAVRQIRHHEEDELHGEEDSKGSAFE
ncbi:HEAT repeat-containing protein [Haladaptatus litoreus]|uniref:HEAT repeat-containing protein n=1 Tax=Haladaptatus litoreus TaxID=553468 RepID=A0A1N7DFR3_9EURY|nr:HEAT repeat domain-containing protein [Haladaptatus litoreus]SIR74575.1 HEAT repeat-containing protein [Haladaptatus litoreus]